MRKITLDHIVLYPWLQTLAADSVPNHHTPALQWRSVGVGWMSTWEQISHCSKLLFFFMESWLRQSIFNHSSICLNKTS